MHDGARQQQACQELGLSPRTLQRWRYAPVDRRPEVRREAPANKLSASEREAILIAANSPGYGSLTPHQIVPRLADEGVYLASESSFYRVLKAAGQGARRGRSKRPRSRPMTTHAATAPNALWCWDITWLPSAIKGRFFYWYMIKDVYSRKLVANEVQVTESSELASRLLTQACLRERIGAGKPLVLHSDNGAAMKGATLLATMYDLGVVPSYSRPRVSNHNAYAEALFRTAKYCPLWPDRSFETIEDARAWVLKFVRWYNHEHRHSALRYVTPEQRHSGQAPALLKQRDALYKASRKLNPARWSRDTRNWRLEDIVYLNPERCEPVEDVCSVAA